MTAGVLLLWLCLALRLRCATLLVVPQDRGTAGWHDGLDATETANEETGALFHLSYLPRGPAVAPHKKAPQFMLDLFNAVSVSDEAPKSLNEILEGNIVRSFEDKGHAGERFHFFNLSSFSREERMVKAEFRWFKKKQKFYQGKSYGPHFYKVDLYEVLDSKVKPWRGNLINSRLVPLYTQGWEVFNVSQMVSKWIQNSQENNGILVVTMLPSGHWVESAASSSKQNRALTDTKSYLVVFSDDGRTGATNQSYVKSNLQPQHLSSRTTAAESDVHLRASRPTIGPSPASGFPSSLTLRRLAGQAGSSLHGDTTPTTAKAPVRSHWQAASGQPTTPQCAPSCMRSSSLATKWEPPAVYPTGSSPSVCYILMMRRTWF
uniref:bone morphogenetic protein 2-A-like isoform X2 n=1 Tax=Monopterus albus TaxID=43700 RepID=UPI0009B3F2A0|nr:bone morphogenetic protein 2-A-like isoform X2 [Monopterus albus]